jgi:hypothetical protein
MFNICICNKSLSSGIYPTRLKLSVEKPAFKNADKLNISNYRPISILTASSKVFKKVIYARLYQHLSQNKILLNEQSGFRNNSSTELASFKLINEILLAVNNKLTVSCIFCDLEKAFTCVNHDILLPKLEFYGVAGKFNTLFTSYLKDRYQKMVIDNRETHNSTSSGWEIVKHGVSQSLILGPQFFLLYINDLPKIPTNKAKIILYADDTSVIESNPSSQDFKININKLFIDINE